ncbi:putative lipid II flippase FtsW [Paenibacillus chitinolyticus]
MSTPRRGTPDFLLLFLTFALVCFGIVMVFSSSSVYASTKFSNPWYFATRQILFAVIGTFLMLFCMNIRYSKLKNWVKPGFLVVVAMLVAVLFFKGINGSRSWLPLGTFSLQPAEFAKLAVIVYLAQLISKKGDNIQNMKKGLMPAVLITAFIAFWILLQPDVGSAAILILCASVVIFVGGARVKHLFSLGVAGGLAATVFLGFYFLFNFKSASDHVGLRMKRFSAYLNPKDDVLDSGFQVMQSLYAFGHGGITGAGFGQSIQKLYLPEPYTDFIFAIIGEELGMIGSILFLLVYIIFLWRGLVIAVRCPDRFGMLTGVGIMTMIGVTAIINIGGVTGTLPMTGVTLPLISYGGSSMMVTLISMGIMLSLSREQNRLEKKEKVEKVTQTTRVYR